MATRQEVYDAFDSERDYQEMRKKRDGTTNDDDRPHSPEEYLVYTQHYLNEALKTASTVWGPDCKPAIMEVVRKVGALCVANMEDNGAPHRDGFSKVYPLIDNR